MKLPQPTKVVNMILLHEVCSYKKLSRELSRIFTLFPMFRFSKSKTLFSIIMYVKLLHVIDLPFNYSQVSKFEFERYVRELCPPPLIALEFS